MSTTPTPGRLRSLLGGRDPSWLALPVGLLAGALALTLLPVPPEMATMVAITLFAVSLWIGTPVPPWFTAIGALGLIGVAFSSELALVGFRAPATWLVIFGLVMGEATRASGVADLVERRVLARVPRRLADDPVGAYRFLLVVLSFAGSASPCSSRPRSYGCSCSARCSSPSARCSMNAGPRSASSSARCSRPTTAGPEC